MRNLRDRTEDFRVLVQQTERLKEKRCPDEPSELVKKKVSRFVAVKTAANNLYSAFGQACTKHTEHQGYIGLQPTHNDIDHVKFVLAFRAMTIQAKPGPMQSGAEGVLWLTIESTIRGSIHQTTSSGILGSLTAAKRAADSSPSYSIGERAIGKEKRKKKTVSFQPDPVTDAQRSKQTCLPPRKPLPDSLPNLCSHSNFCNQIQKAFGQPKVPKHRCIGYLETCSSSKHLLYIDSRMDTITTAAKSSDMIALNDLLTETYLATQAGGILPEGKRIHFGKQLALALLQFHDTRWLKDTWSSRDIVISNAKDDQLNPPKQSDDFTHESYANVAIKEHDEVAKLLKSRPLPYIRNRALFNLGKILLELAFQKPFNELRRPEDLEADPTADSDYFTAKRLLCSVSAELGDRYGEVARKCIECDFGQGDNLSLEKLQASFYQYVICELETCERLARGYS